MANDPVCGMTVEEKSAAGIAVHSGKNYYFCSPKCQHEFEANPVKYAENGKAFAEVSHAQNHTRDNGMV